MTRPTVHAFTEGWYGRLPDYIRVADEKEPSGGGYPLLRMMALLGDQLGDVLDLFNRIDYVPPDETGSVAGDTSDLVNAGTADVAWLPWVAQLVGVHLDRSLSTASQRAQILGSSWLPGTPQALAKLAQSQLTDSKYVRIVDHYGGDPWTIAIRTRTSETPDLAAVLTACQSAKPAGFELVNDAFSTSWDTLEGAYPTWADWEAAGSWTAIEETGAP